MSRIPTSRSSQNWPRSIVQYIAEHPDRPLKARALSRELAITESDYRDFRTLTREMLSDGRLIQGPGRTLVLPEAESHVQGTFHDAGRGYGFISVAGRPTDLYVPRGRKKEARDGDIVLARIVKRKARGEVHAEVERIVRRAIINWVGILECAGRRASIQPIGRTKIGFVRVTNPTACDAQAGDMVVVRPTDLPHGHSRVLQGEIVENLGDPRQTRTKIMAAIRACVLPDTFPDETIANAAKIPVRVTELEIQQRDDLRRQTIVTIDPADARDFDDAISIRRRGPRRVELGVHIADVTHYVAFGSPIDREARRRSTSTYFPGFVLPMLPEHLSNQVCSLQPGEPRLTKSVFITYDEGGRVVATRFANSVIQSSARLTYEQASAAVAEAGGDLPATVLRVLKAADTLARRIQARRIAGGMITLNSSEADIQLDQDGNAMDASPADTSFSHTIIEMFMIEANEAVSRALTDADIPHLRRIHPEPELADTDRFRRVTSGLGFQVPRAVDRTAIRQVLDAVRGQPAEPGVHLLLLRCMAQAVYGEAQEGHFALASETYCHFTSPIRRYPDVVVHRLLDRLIRSGAARNKGNDSSAEVDLAELGRECSAGERRAQSAERLAQKMILLGLMADRQGEEFDGVITGVASFGIFIQLYPVLAEGVMRVEDFGAERWHFDPDNEHFVGERSNRMIGLGQPCRVAIASVDQHAQEMLLVPARDAALGVPRSQSGPLKRRAVRGLGRRHTSRRRR